jgi:hypothetical protein
MHRRADRRGRASATTTAAATGPKIPPVAGDGMPGSDPDDLAGITDLLTGGSLPDTVTAALMGGTDPKIPTLVGD